MQDARFIRRENTMRRVETTKTVRSLDCERKLRHKPKINMLTPRAASGCRVRIIPASSLACRLHHRSGTELHSHLGYQGVNESRVKLLAWLDIKD